MATKSIKIKGVKKFVMDDKGFIDKIRDHEIVKAFAAGCPCKNAGTLCAFFECGGNLNARDSKTGETFLHVFCEYIHLYLSSTGTRGLYLLCTKVDLDVTDAQGDTALHKVARVTGAWRCIVALMRCGANPLVKNKAGRTPEEDILFLKNPGWEENIHWLRKYSPGLWAAVKSANPDPNLIERLLRYWCRTTKIQGSQTVNLKFQVHMCETQLDTVLMLEKYENTNEMALGILSGKGLLINMWKSKENLRKVDVNTCDHSYQFQWRDYPTAPRPLLAAVWEQEGESLKDFMELRPDTSVMWTFESEATSPPKPLFFQLVNPKSRPTKLHVTELILKSADLNIRNNLGQTVLVEAMYQGETEGVIRNILKSGVNVAARDSKGRTARDHSMILKRGDYKEMIDSHVTQMVLDCDIAHLEDLVLQLYDHVTSACSKCQIRHKGSRQLQELIKNVSSTQVQIRKLFSQVKSGNKGQLIKGMSKKYASARDKAGRTLMHYAIQHTQEQQEMSESNPPGAPPFDNIIMADVSVKRLSLNCHKKDNMHNSLIQTQDNNCKLMGMRLRKNCPIKCLKEHFQWTADHVGIINYLIQEYPYMMGWSNNLGQTPLHYAYIYGADSEVLSLLKSAGRQSKIKDVFGLTPEDYNYAQCGLQTWEVRRKTTVTLDLDIFLTESNFEENFDNAVKGGDIDKVKKLIMPLLEHGGEARFSGTLFDCIDTGNVNLASYLVDAGFSVDVSKQYEMCDPDAPLCAMMECGHTSMSLRQRALDLGVDGFVKLIDTIQSRDVTLSVAN